MIAAVCRWMSPPARNASTNAGSRREVREQPQLDLRVVGGEQRPALARNEAAPNVAAELAPDRDVLQVRVARRQASRRRDRLIERRVNAAACAGARARAARRGTCSRASTARGTP